MRLTHHAQRRMAERDVPEISVVRTYTKPDLVTRDTHNQSFRYWKRLGDGVCVVGATREGVVKTVFWASRHTIRQFEYLLTRKEAA